MFNFQKKTMIIKNNNEFISFIKGKKKFIDKDINDIMIDPLIISFEKSTLLDLKFLVIKYPKREYKITVVNEDIKRLNIDVYFIFLY